MGNLNIKIKIRGVDDNKIYTWTLGEVIDRINQDNATDEFNYDESDWVEGFKETLSEFYSLDDTYGKPLNYIGNLANGGSIDDEEEEEEFVVHGHYTVSNSGGYEIMLSDDGDAARVRDAFGSDNPETSDWLEIEYVEDEDGEPDEEGYLPSEPVIDPNGYNIPLNMVMRANRKSGGTFTQLPAQNWIGVKKYGASDKAKKAKPVGYRYKNVEKTSKLYYKTPSDALIKKYEKGDESAREKIYFERRADHSDKSLSGRTFSQGGSLQSLTTKELAEKAGMTMYDVNKHNLDRDDLIAMITEGNYSGGGSVKQTSPQNWIGVKKYGAGDKQKDAKPVGYRYLRIWKDKTKKSGATRPITKDDKEYYLTPTKKLIEAYEDKENPMHKTARKMIYFERRADHSDKSLSRRSYGAGGSVKSIASKFSPKAVKHEGNSKEGYSVLVKDKKSDFSAWIDVVVQNDDVIADWNKYIFHLNDPKDVMQKSLQENNDIFDLATSEAIQYLENNGAIHQDENGEWSYSNKMRNGGGVDSYKIYLKSWDADVYEDDYEQGEGENVNNFGEKVNKSFNSADELMKYIEDNITYSRRLKKEHFNVMDDGRMVTSHLVDNDNSEASESEIERWKKGELKLYSANYNFYISLINERTPSADELAKILGISVYRKGGKVKQRPAQNFTGVEKYGSGDRQKHAKPVGFRYRKIRGENGRLRTVTKDDSKYYKTPTNKEIRAYEEGDKTARKMLYFENRKDHSDREPLKSLAKYANGGSVTIGEYKAKYKVKYSLDGGKAKDGYIVSVLTPSQHDIDYYLLYDNKKELVKKIVHQDAQELVKEKKITLVKSYNVPNEKQKSDGKTALKDMSYAEKTDWIEENILPSLKSASTEWQSYDGDSYDINERDGKETKRYVADCKKSADYENSKDFEKSTGLKIDDSGFGIETKDGEELEEVSSGNTYNQSYLGMTNWNYRVYKADEEKYYLVANPHQGGDVRGNYGDPMFFEGDSQDAVMYDFHEKVISGSRVVYFEFKDKSRLVFHAQQDSDVSYYEHYEGGSDKKKLGKAAQLLLDTFETFGGWQGDDFVEGIVDEFNSSKKKKKELGGDVGDGGLTDDEVITMIENNLDERYEDEEDYFNRAYDLGFRKERKSKLWFQTKEYANGGDVGDNEEIQERLEYLRGELRAERISQGELIELQSLAKYIDKGDVELLEAAGVPEFDDERLGSDMVGQSLSTATLKTEHLIDAFMDFLQSVKTNMGINEKVDKIQDEVDSLERDEDGDFVGEENEETAMYILNDDIFDLLNSIAPEGTSFGSHEGNGSDFGFWEYEEDEYRAGGRMKSLRQKKEQYHDRDVEKYGGRDASVKARPVGYRYRKVSKNGRLRNVNKDDKEYYGTVTKKDIKAYEEGDKSARKRIYFENRKDHSDKNPNSNRGY